MYNIELDTTCANITLDTWEKYMEDKAPYPYQSLCRLILEQLPALYAELSLNLYNPWEDNTYITPTHLVLTHSATEYFFTYHHE